MPVNLPDWKRAPNHRWTTGLALAVRGFTLHQEDQFLGCKHKIRIESVHEVSCGLEARISGVAG
jgi:hypothetical protein